MQASAFYLVKDLNTQEWCQLLSQQEQWANKGSYIYEVEMMASFLVRGHEEVQKEGTYYVCDSKDHLRHSIYVEDEGDCNIRKISFSKIVYLSDVFSRINLTRMEKKLKTDVVNGSCATHLKNKLLPASSLEKMRDKVKRQYFDNSWGATIRRFFSSIANFFIKYNLYLDTGIKWPGNTESYANKVIDKIKRVNKLLLVTALKISQKKVASCLELTSSEIEKMPLKKVENAYKRKALILHPDKSQADDGLFQELDSTFKDFKALSNLYEEFLLDKNKSHKMKSYTPVRQGLLEYNII